MLERVSDETLMAYADGMLEPAEHQRLEALISNDATLARRLQPYVLTRAALPEIFSEALTSPVPDRLVGTVLTAPIGTRNNTGLVAGLPAMPGFLATLREVLFPATPSFSSALALAASVAMIAGAGWTAATMLQAADPRTATLAAAPGARIADGEVLAAALESAPSNTVLEQGVVRVTPILTFRDKTGRLCRQYTLAHAGEGSVSGFACRSHDGAWSVAAHVPGGATQPASSGESYEPASGETTPAALEKAIDAVISGDVLRADQERQLLSSRWVTSE